VVRFDLSRHLAHKAREQVFALAAFGRTLREVFFAQVGGLSAAEHAAQPRLHGGGRCFHRLVDAIFELV
jgi:hypothetical protein